MTTVVTVTFLVLLALNIAPWLRGPDLWRWGYAIPGNPGRLWLPVTLVALYVGAAWWLTARGKDARQDAPQRRRVIQTLALSIVATPAIQLALLYMDHPDPRSQLFYRTVSEGANGFFSVGAVVVDRADFLRYFADRMATWYPTHPQRHPPGLPVLFSLARQFFDATPRWTARLNALYRSYQCHNVSLMNLPDAAIASATLQMWTPLILCLVPWPLYLLGRAIGDRTTGMRAALLWPLVPGIALWAAFWTPVYALFTVVAFLFLHLGLSQHRAMYFCLSGLVISAASFLSFGNVALVGFMGLYTVAWLIYARPRPKWTWLAWGTLLFALGAVAIWTALWLRYDLSFFAVWRKAIGKHLEMDRSGSPALAGPSDRRGRVTGRSMRWPWPSWSAC